MAQVSSSSSSLSLSGDEDTEDVSDVEGPPKPLTEEGRCWCRDADLLAGERVSFLCSDADPSEDTPDDVEDPGEPPGLSRGRVWGLDASPAGLRTSEEVMGGRSVLTDV